MLQEQPSDASVSRHISTPDLSDDWTSGESSIDRNAKPRLWRGFVSPDPLTCHPGQTSREAGVHQAGFCAPGNSLGRDELGEKMATPTRVEKVPLRTHRHLGEASTTIPMTNIAIPATKIARFETSTVVRTTRCAR